ncbi:peptidase S24-like domain protein [Medicago truncatula]|uniref:Peptidase S24-like domain protein n=1 Tax=Medicago truncatula TaxID=3880 RepID=G7LGV4_MEDTR|nr:peptidase S24-like domain protein [Medicago truncatula]
MDSSRSFYLFETISPRFGKIARGDIVCLRSPTNPRESYVKRVIGLEGDSITYVADRGNGYKHEAVLSLWAHIAVVRRERIVDLQSSGPCFKEICWIHLRVHVISDARSPLLAFPSFHQLHCSWLLLNNLLNWVASERPSELSSERSDQLSDQHSELTF